MAKRMNFGFSGRFVEFRHCLNSLRISLISQVASSRGLAWVSLYFAWSTPTPSQSNVLAFSIGAEFSKVASTSIWSEAEQGHEWPEIGNRERLSEVLKFPRAQVVEVKAHAWSMAGVDEWYGRNSQTRGL
ncbi:hypothetical protein PQR15_23515 [Streptomyces lydicus]|nr:hypothetical protein [Streptomyces lydicus]